MPIVAETITACGALDTAGTEGIYVTASDAHSVEYSTVESG